MALRFDRDRTRSLSHFLWQRFIDDKCFETAGALSYTTLVSLVPLIVASLAIFAAFPAFADARSTLVEFVFSNFVPAAGERVQEYLNGFADNASKLTGLSVLVMFFSALSMMVSIEDRLNRIWRVQRQRGWVSRLLLYWAALTLGPVLVVGGLAVASYATALPILSEAAGTLGLRQRLVGTLPFIVTFLTLMLIYMVVPNRRVRWQDGAIGALLGAVLFEIARWGFARFIHHAHTYQQVYGAALAAIPIFLLWIYLSWVIVILCASVAAAVSAFDYEPPKACLPEEAAFLGLLVVLGHFIDAHRDGEQLNPDHLRDRMPQLRHGLIANYFDDLERAEVIRRVEGGGWLLCRSLDSTDLRRVYAHCSYRVPLRPSEEAQAYGLQLPVALVALLDRAALSLDDSLRTRLDMAYPPESPATNAPEDSSP
ncbi:YihY family inner membrane protein [Dyella amyloliquefaciens]|uniref:YihY family inner membrane protein n=1 Tax=Dyella amyloliquefaciens TaxID=1770545 RepID=UPI00102E9CC7|nr:YihY family inner membrane protein [Dyella amyloliquefaciens]